MVQFVPILERGFPSQKLLESGVVADRIQNRIRPRPAFAHIVSVKGRCVSLRAGPVSRSKALNPIATRHFTNVKFLFVCLERRQSDPDRRGASKNCAITAGV
jgi:hypothetical protein